MVYAFDTHGSPQDPRSAAGKNEQYGFYLGVIQEASGMLNAYEQSAYAAHLGKIPTAMELRGWHLDMIMLTKSELLWDSWDRMSPGTGADRAEVYMRQLVDKLEKMRTQLRAVVPEHLWWSYR